MCIIITSMTFVEKQWSLKSICNFPVCILYSYSFVFIFLALRYLLLVVDPQQPFWMPLFKPCSPNKVLCIQSKSWTGMHLLLGSNLDTIKLNLSVIKLVPSVAKAMRCPLGDISMDDTHCVNGAVRITWKEVPVYYKSNSHSLMGSQNSKSDGLLVIFCSMIALPLIYYRVSESARITLNAWMEKGTVN